MRQILILILSFIFSAGCTSAVKFSGRNQPPVKRTVPVTIMKNLPPAGDGVIAVFEGVASYYAEKFHGRTTANGERYDMFGLTAAHNNWPFNTTIRVTNLSNGRNCIIRVNDRMPLHPERIIDLSFGTARELDMVEAGLARVRLEILKWGDK